MDLDDLAPHLGEYMPVTWLTYALDFRLWGLDPFGYHLTGLWLHLLATFVVYALGLALLPRALGHPTADGLAVGAVTAAVLFGLHPLRVEPVAWVSARGTLLGSVFALLTVLAYLRATGRDHRPRSGWLALSLGLYGLALLSRATLVVLPGVLLILDIYPLRRLSRTGSPGVWVEKGLFLALALAMAPLAVQARRADPGVFGRVPLDLLAGVLTASEGLTAYLWRSIWPVGAWSPLNEVVPTPLDPVGGGRLAFLLGLTGLLVHLRRRWPGALAAWLAALVLLVPTSGIVPFGIQRHADRYTYLASVAGALVVGGLTTRAWDRLGTGPTGRARRLALAAGLVGLAAALGLLSAQRLPLWRDSRALWSYTAAVEPRAVTPHLSLGVFFERRGDLTEAARHFAEAARRRPDVVRARVDLGRVLIKSGRPEAARLVLEDAVRQAPTSVEAHVMLASALAAQGHLEKATARYRAALALRPDSAAAHLNLGRALEALGRPGEAILHYRTALTLVPGFEEARTALARLGGQTVAP